jgi:hypothetical protein
MMAIIPIELGRPSGFWKGLEGDERNRTAETFPSAQQLFPTEQFLAGQVCPRCDRLKPELAGKRRDRACDSCRKKWRLKYQRAWQHANPERCRGYSRKWSAANAEQQHTLHMQDQGYRIGDRPATHDAYLRMLAAQDGRCANPGCRTTDPTPRTKANKHRWFSCHHDHDDPTREVLCLLCANCNHAEGTLGSDPERMRGLALLVERLADRHLRVVSEPHQEWGEAERGSRAF